MLTILDPATSTPSQPGGVAPALSIASSVECESLGVRWYPRTRFLNPAVVVPQHRLYEFIRWPVGMRVNVVHDQRWRGKHHVAQRRYPDLFVPQHNGAAARASPDHGIRGTSRAEGAPVESAHDIDVRSRDDFPQRVQDSGRRCALGERVRGVEPADIDPVVAGPEPKPTPVEPDDIYFLVLIRAQILVVRHPALVAQLCVNAVQARRRMSTRRTNQTARARPSRIKTTCVASGAAGALRAPAQAHPLKRRTDRPHPAHAAVRDADQGDRGGVDGDRQCPAVG